MKKTSIALLLGLFALGCGANPPAKPVVAPAMSAEAMKNMQAHTAESASAAPAAGDKKEGEAPAAAPAAEGDKPAEDKKEADAPAKPE